VLGQRIGHHAAARAARAARTGHTAAARATACGSNQQPENSEPAHADLRRLSGHDATRVEPRRADVHVNELRRQSGRGAGPAGAPPRQVPGPATGAPRGVAIAGARGAAIGAPPGVPRQTPPAGARATGVPRGTPPEPRPRFDPPPLPPFADAASARITAATMT